MLRIIQRNRESLIADRQSGSAVGSSEELSDEDLGALRKMGYNTGVEVDSNFYILPGHGQASTGDNIMAWRMADKVIRWIGENKNLFRQGHQRFTASLKDSLFM